MLSCKKSNRSFVLRQGRISQSQQSNWLKHWQTLGIEYQPQTIDIQSYYAQPQPLIVEVGFGMGDSLIAMAESQPHHNFLGIEVHLPGVIKACNEAHSKELANIRFIRHDATDVLQDCLAEQSVAKLLLLFPDPWHKRRHHKRRIVQASFLNLVHRVLAPSGVFQLATDWEAYGIIMRETIEADHRFCPLDHPINHQRPMTKFEKKGMHMGHNITNLWYQKI